MINTTQVICNSEGVTNILPSLNGTQTISSLPTGFCF